MTRAQATFHANCLRARFPQTPEDESEAERYLDAAFADTSIPLDLELGVAVLACILGQYDLRGFYPR